MKKRLLCLALVLVLALSLLPVSALAAEGDLTYRVSGTNVVLSYSINANGNATITDCNDDATGKLVIPGSINGHLVTQIGMGAFQDCDNLISVTIPNSVMVIGFASFSLCDNLVSVTIPDSVTQIEQSAFNECINLTSVVIPDSVTQIGDYAFRGCEKLETITIPDSALNLGDFSIFEDCDNLTNVTLPKGINSVGYHMFRNCTSLETMVIPNTVVSIKSEAFEGCTNLKEITIPGSVESISDDAFLDCSSLLNVTVPKSVKWIGGYALGYLSGNEKLNGFTITGYSDSAAEAYAKENGFPFITLPDPFTDVKGHWAEEAIDYVVGRDLFSGTGGGLFSPNATMTRAMLMTVLARLDGQDTSGGSTWYEKGMTWAKENEISDGSNPMGKITRQQLAVMIYRYAGSPAVATSLDYYSDVDTVSDYAKEAMSWAVEKGIVSGMGGRTLSPNGSATRAQVATMLMRYCQYVKNQ
jgi:hypothetical protein